MTRPALQSIEAYLLALREALTGQDPALIQDALYDAEQHLRTECAAQAPRSEAEVLATIASTYGSPEEVAAAYLDNETRVQAAIGVPSSRLTPQVPARGEVGTLRKFFAVYSDIYTWTALFYSLLALFTGVLYFTFVVTGLALSLGLAILIIGVPFFIAFIGASRLLAWVEGRVVETMSGERMPRRPRSPAPDLSIGKRIAAMFGDWRTWSTLAYFALMLPLGIIYFTIAVSGLAVGGGLFFGAIFEGLQQLGLPLDTNFNIHFGTTDYDAWLTQPIALPLLALAGVLVTTATLHVLRFLIRMHGSLAKRMLVAA